MADEQEKVVENDEYTLGRDYVASARYAFLFSPSIFLPPFLFTCCFYFPRRPLAVRLQTCPLTLTPIFFHRLALLHLLIKAQFGLLHPVIKNEIKTDEGKVKEGLRIADVGTGTGSVGTFLMILVLVS